MTMSSISLSVCLSVCLSVTLCVVAKRYIQQQKCRNCIESAPRNSILQLSTLTVQLSLKLPTACKLYHGRWCRWQINQNTLTTMCYFAYLRHFTKSTLLLHLVYEICVIKRQQYYRHTQRQLRLGLGLYDTRVLTLDHSPSCGVTPE